MEKGPAVPREWLLRALELETGPDHDPDRLVRETTRAFRDAAAESAADPEAAPRLRAYAARLRRSYPTSAGVGAAMARCAAAAGAGAEAAIREADVILGETRAAAEQLIRGAASLLRPGSRPLTHAFGGLVLEIFRSYSDRIELVTVSEGRPRNEGIRLAAGLAELALPVRLITEAQWELFLPECDLVVTEAERVLPDRSVVAAAGTAVLARLCAAHGVPLHVIAPRSRWIPEGDELAQFRPERRPPAEVLADPPPGVEVVNLAHDHTPAELVAGILTEASPVPAGRYQP